MDFFDPDSNQQVRPNLMQRQALKEISPLPKSMGVNKALVVAATGSGKTYLAAFDAFNFQAKKASFHRSQRHDFGSGDARRLCMFSGPRGPMACTPGKTKDGLTADFLFASNIILAQ
jgi:hypothetical protein